MVTIYEGTTYAHTTSGTLNYISCAIKDYLFIVVSCTVGNVNINLIFPNGDVKQQYIIDTLDSPTEIRGGFLADWTNNKFGIRYLSASGFTYKNVYVTKIVGCVKK